jgi:hypothetical protein
LAALALLKLAASSSRSSLFNIQSLQDLYIAFESAALALLKLTAFLDHGID